MGLGDYFTEAQFREWADDKTSPYKYEQGDVERAHDEVVEYLERWAKAAWVPRTGFVYEVPGLTTPELWLPRGPVRSISSVLIDGVESTGYYTLADRIWWGTGLGALWPRPTVVVTYDYGYDGPPPLALARAAVYAARSLLSGEPSRTKVPRNVSSYANAATTFTFLRDPNAEPPAPWPWDEEASELARAFVRPRRRVMTVV